MRAQRTAQPRRACDTTVFSCANGEVSVRSVTLSHTESVRIASGPVRFGVRGLTVPLRRTADVVPTFVVTARFWAILGKFHCPSSLSSQRSRVRTGPDIYFPRRSRVARPRADPVAGVHDHGRDHPSPLDARRSGAERCTVVLVALCLWICAQWRVCARRSGD